MPIYAYRCEACGFAKDALQKISDAPLTDCPACGKSTFKKQITAAGFRLKGTGWYATDFRGGQSVPAEASNSASASAKSNESKSASDDGSTGASSASSPASAASAASDTKPKTAP